MNGDVKEREEDGRPLMGEAIENEGRWRVFAPALSVFMSSRNVK